MIRPRLGNSSNLGQKDDKEYLPTDNFRPRDLRAQILLECEDILNKLDNQWNTFSKIFPLDSRTTPPVIKLYSSINTFINI